jgi:hypothetical protein
VLRSDRQITAEKRYLRRKMGIYFRNRLSSDFCIANTIEEGCGAGFAPALFDFFRWFDWQAVGRASREAAASFGGRCLTACFLRGGRID